MDECKIRPQFNLLLFSAMLIMAIPETCLRAQSYSDTSGVANARSIIETKLPGNTVKYHQLTNITILSARALAKRLILVVKQSDSGPTTTMSIPWNGMSVKIDNGSFWSSSDASVSINGITMADIDYTSSDKKERVQELGSALNTLRTAASAVGIADNEKIFAESLMIYRNASPKPTITEEVHRFSIQAEAMVSEKNFSEAAALYEKGLDLLPWWPEGRFNRATVLGEIGEYETAIDDMKRYLELVPDAPDARSAQDQIYKWEALLGRS